MQPAVVGMAGLWFAFFSSSVQLLGSRQIPIPRIFQFFSRKTQFHSLKSSALQKLTLPKISETANSGFVLLQGVCQRKGAGGEPAGFSEAEAAATDRTRAQWVYGVDLKSR